MVQNRIRIYPNMRRPIDTELLTNALLDLLDHLSTEERRRFIAEGERVLKEVKGKPKGSAA